MQVPSAGGMETRPKSQQKQTTNVHRVCGNDYDYGCSTGNKRCCCGSQNSYGLYTWKYHDIRIYQKSFFLPPLNHRERGHTKRSGSWRPWNYLERTALQWPKEDQNCGYGFSYDDLHICALSRSCDLESFFWNSCLCIDVKWNCGIMPFSGWSRISLVSSWQQPGSDQTKTTRKTSDFANWLVGPRGHHEGTWTETLPKKKRKYVLFFTYVILCQCLKIKGGLR